MAPNPNPFTFKGTGVYIIGRGQVAVIDPGPTLDDHLDAVMGALDPGESVSHILVTHTHTDHTAGVPKLKDRTGAPTYGFGPHAADEEGDNPAFAISFDEYMSHDEKSAIETMWEEIPEELKREGPDHDFVPDHQVQDGDRIEGEGWTVEVVHTPGHTSNHVCYALAGERLLFTGDHVMGWSTSVIAPPDGDLYDYLASLRKLLVRDDVRYWPTHGPAIDNPQHYVQSFIEHRQSREDQIVAALTASPCTIKAMVPSMYADTNKFLWRAAANSVYSHLVALEREGRARPSDEGSRLHSPWELVG